MAKKCKTCEKEFTPKYSTTERHCSRECFNKDKKPNLKLKSPKKINQVSEKRKLENIIYKSERIKFLSLPENKKCPITGKETTEIHHMMKRRGFADKWAIDNKLSLYLDKRFWLAVSRKGHEKIENNPNWAIEQGFSIRSNQKL